MPNETSFHMTNSIEVPSNCKKKGVYWGFCGSIYKRIFSKLYFYENKTGIINNFGLLQIWYIASNHPEPTWGSFTQTLFGVDMDAGTRTIKTKKSDSKNEMNRASKQQIANKIVWR